MDDRGWLSSRRAGRRGALVFASLALGSFALLLLLDAYALHARLTSGALQRATMRLSTSANVPPTLPERPWSATNHSDVFDAVDVAKSERDRSLVGAARQWLNASTYGSKTERRDVVLRGLARWDVATKQAATLFAESGDADLFRISRREELVERRRQETNASRDAKNALAELAEEDQAPALDAAQAFLRELGADDPVEQENLDALQAAFLLPDAYDARDPIDLAGYVAPNDFAFANEAILAVRLCGASSRLFLLLTLGVLPCGSFSRVGSVLMNCRNLARLATARADAPASKRLVVGATNRPRRYDPLVLVSTVRILD